MRPFLGFGKNKTIIIGIHGLSNKPSRKCLKRWWLKSLREGLITHEQFRRKFQFRMVYWADILYDKPMNTQDKNKEDPYYVDEPYLTAKAIKSPISIDFWQKILLSFNKFREYIFLSRFGIGRFQYPFDFILKKSFKDLDSYYNENHSAVDKMRSGPVKLMIRDRLVKILKKCRHRRVLLIAHSMGSIIAYDVLFELQSTGVGIDTLITIGSPLGLPMIRQKFSEEYGSDDESDNVNITPDNIGNWYNLSDEDDQLAAHHDLSEVFSMNKHMIKPIEQIVVNDYKYWITANAHKSFGYLRTPELSNIVLKFLTESKKSWLQKIKQSFRIK